jgi:phage/plasmid-associated DNA primase
MLDPEARVAAERGSLCLLCTGNGKVVTKQMLEAMLGDYYGVMSKDAVVKPPGQRPSSKGAATGYLAELRGKRVAVTDETSPGERVDLGLVLMMTGGGQVKFRMLFENNTAFRFSHTPFIQTNYDPEIPPTLAKQPNIDRRLIVVRFPNEYVSEDRFDQSNPNHRRVDAGLKEQMETPAVREEFLTFLVKGSCAWYANPTILHAHPPAVQAAQEACLRRGDKLQTFLDQHCIMDPEGTPEREKTVAWEEEFWGRFQVFMGAKIHKEELERQMRGKGYVRTKRRCVEGDPASKRVLCYIGLKCEY